jgi:hypothetical protein
MRAVGAEPCAIAAVEQSNAPANTQWKSERGELILIFLDLSSEKNPRKRKKLLCQPKKHPHETRPSPIQPQILKPFASIADDRS